MQLRSIALASLLLATAQAQDSISINYLYYDEDSGRTTIKTPNISITKEFGTDYVMRFSYTHDSVTGASPTFYDAATGASATIPQGILTKQDIRYGDIPYEEDRKAYSFSLTKRLPVTRNEITVGYNFSHEHDYISKELSLEYLRYSDATKNHSITYGISYQRNYPKIYCFMNHPECDAATGASSVTRRSETITAQIGMTQVLSKNSQIKSSIFAIFENGYLSNPYMRIVRYYDSYAPKIDAERKPDSRKAIGWSLEYKKAWETNYLTLQTRLYYDDWEILSGTITARLDKELTSKLDVGVQGRWYRQSSAYFYSSAIDYFTDQQYASSDRRMSAFSAYEATLCLKYQINDTISLSLDASYYDQPKYLQAIYSMVGVEYRF